MCGCDDVQVVLVVDVRKRALKKTQTLSMGRLEQTSIMHGFHNERVTFFIKEQRTILNRFQVSQFVCEVI